MSCLCYSTATRAPRSPPQSPNPVMPSKRVCASGPYLLVSARTVCFVFVRVHCAIMRIH